MVYKYKDWALYTKKVNLKGNTKSQIYFFAKKIPKSGEPCELPDGWEVKESKNKGSGMPYLKRK